MLRELISWVLNTYLGKYLENFNPAQLTIALLSGEVELENVPFRKDAFRGLGLPLEALSGSIGKIKLQVPVRQFRTAPWCLVIEKVYIIIGPKNLNDWDEEKEQASDLEYKICQLDDIEAKWRTQREACLESGYYASSYSGWLNYGAGLVTNIIENLQLKVNDVHIRYEDSITIPNSRIACGITINSLSAQSCDSNWVPGFTTAWNQNVASFKLVELQSFSFYWDRLTNNKTFGNVPSCELASVMQMNCAPKDHNTILSPISAQAHFKRDRSETPLRTRSRPRLCCEVLVDEITVTLTDFQYTQMIECVKGLEVIRKLQKYRLLRPSVHVKESPKLWWKYAARCHGLHYENAEQKWEKATENLKYIKIYSKLVLNPNENLTPEEKDLKNLVESKRCFEDLKILREICFLHVPNSVKIKENSDSQGKSMLFQWFPQWWGWYGSGNSDSSPVDHMTSSNSLEYLQQLEADVSSTTNKDQISIEDEILNALEAPVENNSFLKRDAVFGKFNFTLDGGQFNICSEKHSTAEVIPMMKMHFDNLKLCVETRPRSGSHLLALSLGSVCVKDLLTPNTEFPDLIKPQSKEDNLTISFNRYQNQRSASNASSVVNAAKKENSNATSQDALDKSEPWFQLQYEKKPLIYNTDYRLALKSKSLDVVYNTEALRWLIDFFTKPLQTLSGAQKIEAMKENTKMKFIKNWKNIIEGDLGQRKSWSLEIDVSAPQIIFVENFNCKNTTVVLVDFGRFQLLKNSTPDKIRQQKNPHVQLQSDNSSSSPKFEYPDSEEEDAFMTPCSTPPGSENSLNESPTAGASIVDMPSIINEDTGLENAFHNKIYDKYTMELTELQVLVCKGKERWGFASLKGTSALHVLDRFNITIHLERRIVHTLDPDYPSFTVYGTLPKLVAHINENKISALYEIVNMITPSSTYKVADTVDNGSNLNENYLNDNEGFTNSLNPPSSSGNATPTSPSKEQSKLIVLHFAVDQMSLEVQSRGRSIAELQVSGVRAGLSRRAFETNISLSVHGLLLVDAIQSFGPDFELLVASHRHVGMDSISGSLKQSEPCSPLSPASPDPSQNKRPTSPQTLSRALNSLQRANSATWSNFGGDLDALITVEINLITTDDDKDDIQIANINFNNLDIIANQETIVELLGFIKRVIPSNANQISEIQQKSLDLDNRPKEPERNILPKMEITFDFNRLNILVLRALMRDSFLVGRKVGTFTMCEAKIHATVEGPVISVEGSLGGLQILDLTPEGVNHQRILSVGKDPLTEPPEIENNLMSSLTQEVYGTHYLNNTNNNNINSNSTTSLGKAGLGKIYEQRQALSFAISRNVHAVVSIKIRMASVWYTHCARFMQELSWCATEFKHYLKNFAKSIQAKATDMAYGLVQSKEEEIISEIGSSRRKLYHSLRKPPKRKKAKRVTVKLDIVFDTPVLVVPRSSCSSQVLVAHLGQISVNNSEKKPSNVYKSNEDNVDECQFEMDFDSSDKTTSTKNVDVYTIDVRNMNLFSLDTSRRKGFRLSALPRAEDFYSCQQDAVAILHDTALSLYISKHYEDGDHRGNMKLENTLFIEGSVIQPLQISLSRRQYEQVLETVDNIFKVPNDLMRPPTEVSISINESTLPKDFDNSSFDLRGNIPLNENNVRPGSSKLNEESATIQKNNGIMPKVAFSLPIFIIRLKNEHDNPLIEISFREFNVHYEKLNTFETHIKVSLRSILMEDLLCSIDSKYRHMVVSSPEDSKLNRQGKGVASISCPDLVKIPLGEECVTGSLPDNLEQGAGFHKISNFISNDPDDGNEFNKQNMNRSRTKLDVNDYPDTPPPSPQPKAFDDNLVIYSATLIDPDCPGLNTQYKSLKQSSSIDFNSLNLIVSVERWYMLLNFFGLFSDEEDDRRKANENTGAQPSDESKGNTELEITVRSLTLILVRNEAELAKINISNAFFVVSQHGICKIVEGSLGSVSLYDLTRYGKIYREKFLTSGSEALKFVYKRETEKNNQRTLNKDAKLKIHMSSVRYVHTKRFVMEIQNFFKEFLQLQTPVLRKMKVSDYSKYNIHQRPTQLGLEIKAGSPIILLPLSFESNQVIVADLGEFTLKNSFHLASEPHVISKKSDVASLDEILDVMQVNLVNTNFFTGDRSSKEGSSYDLESVIRDYDVRFDMGSYWIIKRGKGLLEEKCHLKLQIERNMDSWKSHNCPDFSVQGVLSRLRAVLDVEQYKLVRGFLSYNLGEPIDDIYSCTSFSLADSRINLSMTEAMNDTKLPDSLIWTNMSINLDLEDVSLVLNWLPASMIPSLPVKTTEMLFEFDESSEEKMSVSLACINFIKSCLKIDSFSDGSQDVDLVSQEILITDDRFHHKQQGGSAPTNIFTNILQPIRQQMGTSLVQAEVHSRRRNDHCKYTILLNNMRLMAIIDWIENMQEYLSQNAEAPRSGYLGYSQSRGIATSSNTLEEDKTPMEITLNITDSELVLVEKMDQMDTNAVILKSTTVVSFKPSDSVKPVSINLNHLEVFSCILGYENETALSIIDPITINLDIRSQAIEIQIQKQFCIRLSYHDVKMFIRMLESISKQSRKAQINSTQIQEAALWLAQKQRAPHSPVPGAVKKLTIAETTDSANAQGKVFDIQAIKIRANCISICVIDDCKDADVPLLELSLSQLEFKQEFSMDTFMLPNAEMPESAQTSPTGSPRKGFWSGHLYAILATDYYNRNLSGWEPIIESWECNINWNYSTGKQTTANENRILNLNICSDKLLKCNITSTLIELWQLVRKNWTQDYYEGSTSSANQHQSMYQQYSFPLSPTGYRRRTPFIPFSLQNNTGEDLWFKILLTLPGGITRTEISNGGDISNNQWIKVKPNERLPFSFGQQNKLRHLDSHKLNLHQVLVHIDGWSKVGPVSIDKVGVFFRHAHRESPEYASMPKARIVFSVTLEGSAQKLITIRSALRVINKLDDIILLKMEHPNNNNNDWPMAKTAIVGSSEKYSVPLSHVHALIFFRPLINFFDDKNGNNFTIMNSRKPNDTVQFPFAGAVGQTSALSKNDSRYFQFCEEGINWQDCTEISEVYQNQRICKGNRDKLYNVVVTIKRDGYPQKEATFLPGHTITFVPPLRINNLLCCDLLYKLNNNLQGRIQPSGAANIYDLNLLQKNYLIITLDGYKSSGQISIPVGFIGAVEPKLHLQDIRNRDLYLRASIQAVRGNGVEISISAPFWLVNKTGLPIVFRQEGVPHPASGQFEEHETARVVSPLMFSFSDPDASPALEVRLGNRFGVNPPWCHSLSLHKDVVHRQLKSGNTNETFIIGVEIRRGRGRYSRTSVVTFSPRFQLYNRSQHKLKFSQKCFVIEPTNPESRRAIIEAVPGCHFPFHWPRSDQEPLLCVKLDEVPDCCWSSGIPIEEAQSLYINIRNERGDMYFLRLEVVLQGATYFLLFGDAKALPPPIRIDNYSEVPMSFFQSGHKRGGRTMVKPRCSLSYALDNPTGSQNIEIEAPGTDSYEFSLRDLNVTKTLTYSNFLYIAFKGTFASPSMSENLHLASEYDMESQHLVLGVKNNKVILMRKLAGDRSQLWLMNSSQQLEHEGSSPPSEPGKKGSSSQNPRLVLDVERALNPMDYTPLVVRPANKTRQLTQTWHFVNDRLMCGHANMCVQTRYGIFGLQPGCEVVLGRIDSDINSRRNSNSSSVVPVEQHIERQKLRPGSGLLSVTLKMDGPIRTLQIRDVKSEKDVLLNPDPQWKHASSVISNSPNACNQKMNEKHTGIADIHNVSLQLSKGVGLSIVSKAPCEELAYITLEQISLEAREAPFERSIEVNVGDLQIDNQLLESPCPILLYTSKSSSSSSIGPGALVFSAKLLPSPNNNAVIFERFILILRPFNLHLEERLVLRAAVFLGFGTPQDYATSLADESEYEAQQVATKILAANAKRYYFENLEINIRQLRLSVITASKLSPQLSEIKKKLGLTLIRFEDALIEFDAFTDRHHFETLEIYLRAIKSYYKNQLKWHAASILGSVDFLGNPLGFANDLSEGISGLIRDGSVKNLVKNVAHGISNSTAKLTETLSDGLGHVVLDEHDRETRQKILEVAAGHSSSGEHLTAGLKGFGFGVFGGFTSIVKHTYEGVQNDGVQGFFSGLGKGVVGTLTKPIIGVLDLASEAANAVRESSKSAHRVLPERKRLPRCVTGAPGGLLPPYSHTQAKGQQHLYSINKRDFSEKLMSYEPNLLDDREGRLRLLVSTEYVRIFSRIQEDTTIILSHHLSEVVSCHPVTANRSTENHKKKPQYFIEIASSPTNMYKRPRVRCQSEEMAEKASRHINYAKGVYDEREQTINSDLDSEI